MNRDAVLSGLRQARGAIERSIKRGTELVSIDEAAFHRDLASALRLIMDAMKEVEKTEAS